LRSALRNRDLPHAARAAIDDPQLTIRGLEHSVGLAQGFTHRRDRTLKFARTVVDPNLVQTWEAHGEAAIMQEAQVRLVRDVLAAPSFDRELSRLVALRVEQHDAAVEHV